MSASDHVKVSFGSSEGHLRQESVEASLTSPDIVAGFSVYFRQLYDPDEEASFNKAMSIAMAVTASNPALTELRDLLKAWGRTAGRMRRYSMRQLVLERLHEQGEWPPLDETDRRGFDAKTPERIISEHLYGDHIHWGRHAEKFEQRRASEFEDAWARMDFRDAITALAHLYIGFAVLLQHAFSKALALPGAIEESDRRIGDPD